MLKVYFVRRQMSRKFSNSRLSCKIPAFAAFAALSLLPLLPLLPGYSHPPSCAFGPFAVLSAPHLHTFVFRESSCLFCTFVLWKSSCQSAFCTFVLWGIFLSVCLLHFRSLESVGTDLRSFLYRRTRFPLISAVFHKRRYKNDALSVPTLFSCQLFLSGGINHTVSLLCFGNLPVSLPSALSFFGKRRYRFALVSVPTLPISPD